MRTRETNSPHSIAGTAVDVQSITWYRSCLFHLDRRGLFRRAGTGRSIRSDGVLHVHWKRKQPLPNKSQKRTFSSGSGPATPIVPAVDTGNSDQCRGSAWSAGCYKFFDLQPNYRRSLLGSPVFVGRPHISAKRLTAIVAGTGADLHNNWPRRAELAEFRP